MNYYTSAFLAQSCLRIWLNSPVCPWTRHIVFTSSTAAFVGLPGYIAYTPASDIARKIIKALEKGHTYITVDFQSSLLLNNMRGPSPRHWSLYDFILGLIAVVGWWWARLDFDRRIRRYGYVKGYSRQ